MIRSGIFSRLKPISFFLMIFPILYVVLLVTVFNIPLNKVIDILLSFLTLISFAGLVISGYGFYKFKRWSWYFFLLTQGLTGVLTLLLIEDISKPFGWILPFCFIGFQILFIYRVSKIVYVPFVYPRIRWWENNPKLRGSIHVDVFLNQEQKTGDILDFSEQGCFIKMSTQGFAMDSHITIQFKIFSHLFESTCLVIWIAPPAVTHPEGVGLKFIGLDRRSKKDFKLATKRMKRINQFYRRNRYFMKTSDFIRDLKDLESKSLHGL